MLNYLSHGSTLDAGTITVLIVDAATAMVLLSAGVRKLWRHFDFTRSIERYEILPAAFVGVVATAIIALEISLGVLLLLSSYLFRGLALATAIASGVLFAGFALAMTVNLIRGRAIPCGCGTTGFEVDINISWSHALRSMAVAILLVVLALVTGDQVVRLSEGEILISLGACLITLLAGSLLSYRRVSPSRSERRLIIDSVMSEMARRDAIVGGVLRMSGES